jgi:imidazoleglycerol-phosphate dehydratase
MRRGDITRKTAETDVRLSLNLDGGGAADIDTGIGFMDHMLTLFARHGGFDLSVSCVGDTHVDAHHSVEDIGLCLGKAFADAIGDMRGISRYGDIILPMDEALILCAVDISGRGHLAFDVPIETSSVGTMDTELVEEFLISFTRRAGLTLHLKKLAGTNTHHVIEGCFKALSRALSKAAAIDLAHADEIPSTKGVL